MGKNQGEHEFSRRNHTPEKKNSIIFVGSEKIHPKPLSLCKFSVE